MGRHFDHGPRRSGLQIWSVPTPNLEWPLPNVLSQEDSGEKFCWNIFSQRVIFSLYSPLQIACHLYSIFCTDRHSDGGWFWTINHFDEQIKAQDGLVYQSKEVSSLPVVSTVDCGQTFWWRRVVSEKAQREGTEAKPSLEWVLPTRWGGINTPFLASINANVKTGNENSTSLFCAFWTVLSWCNVVSTACLLWKAQTAIKTLIMAPSAVESPASFIASVQMYFSKAGNKPLA